MKKRVVLLLLSSILSICMLGCSNTSTADSSKSKEDFKSEVASQYDFYDESVAVLKKEMDVNSEQADSIFQILVSIGMDEKITYCFDKDEFFKVWWGSNSVDMYAKDGIVEKIMDGSNQLYPSSDNMSGAEKILSSHQEIIWKDDENIGMVNLELDGEHVKEAIVNDFYVSVANYLNDLDKNSLKDYESLQFVGNVMNDGKINCTIKGSMSIPAIKSYEKEFDYMVIEDNITDLFIPKPLQ